MNINLESRFQLRNKSSGQRPAGNWQQPRDLDRHGRPVHIFCMGRFGAQANGEAVKLRHSRQQKPLELLQALIAFGGREVHADLLTQALWPDAEGDDAQNAFDVTLHRLRNVFQLKELFVLQDRKLTLNSELAWVDVWAFEKLINRCEQKLQHSGSRAVRRQLLEDGERLLALYQGAFLEREGHRSWSISLRERLRSKLLRHIQDAGHILESASEWNLAIRYFRKGIEIEPLAEELYRELMHCYQKSGRIPEALAAYQRCRQVLAEQLQLEPSADTLALHEAIRN